MCNEDADFRWGAEWRHFITLRQKHFLRRALGKDGISAAQVPWKGHGFLSISVLEDPWELVNQINGIRRFFLFEGLFRYIYYTIFRFTATNLKTFKTSDPLKVTQKNCRRNMRPTYTPQKPKKERCVRETKKSQEATVATKTINVLIQDNRPLQTSNTSRVLHKSQKRSHESYTSYKCHKRI